MADKGHDVWGGSDGLPVRLKQKTGTMTVTMDFEGFGRSVAVEAPAASRTADLTEVIRNQQRRQG
ncbi:hypothetical protein ACFY8B_08800 [Streptomyces sp. NPDC012751]|uniref:hypothetical protein n=1 Tax=Streptomyces sp. NPDC012751 TaxID=3364846 RepID=UPI003680CD12